MHMLFHLHARIQTDTSVRWTYQVFVSDYKELLTYALRSLRLPEYKQRTVQH